MKKTIVFIFLIIITFVTSYAQVDTDSKVWTLEECINYALENNLSVQRTLYGIESGEVNVKQSKWSMAPSLNFGGSYNNSWGRSIDPTTNLFTTERFETAGLTGSSSWLLFQTNRLRNTYKQALVNLDLSKADHETSKNSVILGVITFYTNAVFNRELLNNAISQLNSTDQLVSRTQKQVDAGAAPQTQLYDILAQKATNEVNVINADNNFNLSVLQLKQALQIPATEPFDIEIPTIELDQFQLDGSSLTDIYQIALEIMPEIQSANLGLESADLGVKIARAQFYPSLRLNASLNTNYSSVRDAQRIAPNGTTVPVPATPIGTVNLDPTQVVYTNPTTRQGFDSFESYPFLDQFGDNFGRFVGLNLSIPVFNGFAVSSNVQRAIISKRQAEITYEERSNTLRQTIERAYNDVLASQKSYDASTRQVEAQEESFRVTQRSYELGAMNFFDFQVSQNNLFQAKNNLLISKYDYIFKLAILKFYLGDLNY